MTFMSGYCAIDALLDCHHRHAVDDHHVALVAEIVGKILARDAACAGVVDREIDQSSFGTGVDADDRDAGVERLLDLRRDRLGVGSVDEDDIAAGGDHRVDRGDLLVEVVVMRDDGDLGVRGDLLDLGFHALGEGDIERVTQWTEGYADGLQVFGLQS
jgi:hypothetical protein